MSDPHHPSNPYTSNFFFSLVGIAYLERSLTGNSIN